MIACIAAMQPEMDALLDLCHEVKRIEHSSFTLFEATLDGQHVIIGLSGIGKVSAAAITSLIILTYQPSLIINIGSAGGLDAKLAVGDTVIATMCAYHDFDLRAFGHPMSYEQGRYVFKPHPQLIEKMHGLSHARLHFGPMVCGDQFINDEAIFQEMCARFTGVLATDMESTAIAHVASIHNTDWIIARAISDLVFNHDNHVAFDTFLALASVESAFLVKRIIQHLT